MPGTERYERMGARQYDRKTLMYYLCRTPANRRLLPAVAAIRHSKVLDVGLGTGAYTRLLLEEGKGNTVVGVDLYPHLCELPITVHRGDAAQLRSLVGAERFDLVLSTWMTDYLSPDALRAFVEAARAVLAPGGELVTTVIATYGFGFLYVRLAKLLRGVDKYTYRRRGILEMLRDAGFESRRVYPLRSWCFPWAYLVRAR